MTFHPRTLLDLLRVLMRDGTLLTALKVSAVVGSVLNLINQGEHVVAGGSLSWRHAFLNFLVPFCVSLYSGWRAKRRRTQPVAAPRPADNPELPV